MPVLCPYNRNSALPNEKYHRNSRKNLSISGSHSQVMADRIATTFTSEGRQNGEWDIRMGKVCAVMRQLHQYVVLKRELCTKTMLPICRSV